MTGIGGNRCNPTITERQRPSIRKAMVNALASAVQTCPVSLRRFSDAKLFLVSGGFGSRQGIKELLRLLGRAQNY